MHKKENVTFLFPSEAVVFYSDMNETTFDTFPLENTGLF